MTIYEDSRTAYVDPPNFCFGDTARRPIVAPLDTGSNSTTVKFAWRLEALVVSDEHGRFAAENSCRSLNASAGSRAKITRSHRSNPQSSASDLRTCAANARFINCRLIGASIKQEISPKYFEITCDAPRCVVAAMD